MAIIVGIVTGIVILVLVVVIVVLNKRLTAARSITDYSFRDENPSSGSKKGGGRIASGAEMPMLDYEPGTSSQSLSAAREEESGNIQGDDYVPPTI